MTATAASPIHHPTGPDAFDFLHGRWVVRHRQLKQRHIGADDWAEFEGTCYCEPRLGGMANIEEHDFAGRGGDKGIALRLYDPKTGDWSVYWVSDRDGVMQPPVSGKFDGPGCILYGEDTDSGRPIVARYHWSRTDMPNPRWEQAFSLDGGETWETNWVMDWTRVE